MTKQKYDTRLSWKTMLLAAPPIGVFFLSDALSWGFTWQGKLPMRATLDAAAFQLDASIRPLVLAAAVVGFGLAYLIMLRFIADLRDEFGSNTRAQLLAWYGAGILIGMLWVLCSSTQIPVDDQLGKDSLKAAFGLLGPAGGMPGDMLLCRFQWLALCSRIAFMFAAGVVVIGGISSLVEPTPKLEGDENYAFQRRQHGRLRTYVNAAAALLVVSLVFQVAWMRWSLVALDPAVAKTMGPQVDAFAIFTGVMGSVVIALFAIPASTILVSRAAALPQVPNAAPDAPLLDTRLFPSVGKILAVLAPTLAGSLPTIFDLLGKLVGPS
jgi:hypothetical protein